VTTLQIEVADLTFSQSDWHKVGSVNGRSANRRLRNWSVKMWKCVEERRRVNRRL